MGLYRLYFVNLEEKASFYFYSKGTIKLLFLQISGLFFASKASHRAKRCTIL